MPAALITKQLRLVHGVRVLLPELVDFGGHVNVNGIDVELGDDTFHYSVVLTGLPLGNVTLNPRCNRKHPIRNAEVVHQLEQAVVPPLQNGIANIGCLVLAVSAVIVRAAFEMVKDTK